MTTDKMDLHALVRKTADGDFLREMIGFAAQRLMYPEVGGLTGAERLAPRNGYRDRDWGRTRGPSSCASPSCAKAVAFLAFSSLGGWLRRR